MESLSLEKAKSQFHQHVLALQDQITESMKERDPSLKLQEDLWERKDFLGAPGGGGRTRAFNGKVFEKAGVNTSCVSGAMDPDFAKKLGADDDQLWAAGISLIIHPLNPRVPTVHANFRMIQAGSKFWFGGGADLTPYYPYEEDFCYFHGIWKTACEPYNCYSQMKKSCDDYFTNHHREGEMRGIGGIFYDHFNSGDLKKDFEMSLALSEQFIPSYFPLVDKRVQEDFTPEDEDFQLHRRGRYVEFNLIHDRGTTFGLKTKGRTESILISLPPRVKFTYGYAPTQESVHGEMMKNYYPKDW